MAKLLVDFPSGPLDYYRKKASFDWKKMKVFLNTEEMLEFEYNILEEIKNRPVLLPTGWKTLPVDEQRRLSMKRMFEIQRIKLVSTLLMMDNTRKPSTATNVFFQLDPSSSVKQSISFGMFPGTLQGLGTGQHYEIFQSAFNGEIIGAYCLTEIGHGTNSKKMMTTATYDKNTKEFILHSPSFEAAKCWAGLLGQLATHAIVYAQLITPDGKCHGLHAFIVQIRDPETLLAYPGVTVGDMGEKIALNGIDNGFVMFNKYRLPKTALLNKLGDVDNDGNYISPYKDPNKRHGASLGILSAGRVTITNISSVYAGHAISIAIRYAGVRKQFGPENGEEVPILEYQSHQCRLLPHLAVAYVLKDFTIYIVSVLYKLQLDSLTENNDNLADLGIELHAVSSASKCVSAWITQDTVRECREACAGHGYLKVSGLGDIKNRHDANCTYEGENHVLIQQTSNWLLKLWPLVLQGEKLSYPLQSVNFLNNANKILASTLNVTGLDEFLSANNILHMYQWLVCYLLKVSYEKYQKLVTVQKVDSFQAKNETQVFFSKSLAIVYIHHFMLYKMHQTILRADDPSIKKVLTNLFSLYGVWFLEKNLSTFYQGGYTRGPELPNLIQEGILHLCRVLKDDAIALVDAIALPDFLMHSVLGRSDGQVYKHLEKAMVGAPGALDRPKWWKEVVSELKKTKSKL